MSQFTKPAVGMLLHNPVRVIEVFAEKLDFLRASDRAE
jgi:hypothetical protein